MTENILFLPNIRQKQTISADIDFFCKNILYLQKWSLSAKIILFLQKLITPDCIINFLAWMDLSDMALLRDRNMVFLSKIVISAK